ncbi:ComEC/Rec2 family competence protein, partial [Candidatus Microgenomates bacterium]|nr:ComEC/Rec2 family competence protein [Candidatus Microgenomates bacterium]
MSNPFLSIINSLLPEPQASLLGGILFGVKATMPKDLYNALVVTGTLHIIALSGMNVSILVNLIAKITSFLGKKASSIVTICLIVIFTLFV